MFSDPGNREIFVAPHAAGAFHSHPGSRRETRSAAPPYTPTFSMNSRIPAKILTVTAVILCAYGALASASAAIRVFATPSGPFAGIFNYPRWGLAHFVPGLLFMTLAPLQLWPAFRNRHRALHRRCGRVMAACALFLGVSGVSFIFLMPARPLAERIFMLTFFTAFLFFLAKALAAARRRDFAGHRVWMIRMFVTGLTITSQRILMLAFLLTRGAGSTDQFWNQFVAAAWLAWAIHLAAAEWWIQSRAPRAAVTPVRKLATL